MYIEALFISPPFYELSKEMGCQICNAADNLCFCPVLNKNICLKCDLAFWEGCRERYFVPHCQRNDCY